MESIFSIIFAFLVEAIILLQYTSRLFSPKRPLSDRLVVLSLLYTCLCAAAFFNIKWLNMLLYLFTNFLFSSHNTMSNGAQLPSIPHCLLLSWECAS